MRVIKISIESLDDFTAVYNHLKNIGFSGHSGGFHPQCPNPGFIVLRNKDFIIGDLSKAIHKENEDLPITASRFLKLSENAVNEILDTKNFIDN